MSSRRQSEEPEASVQLGKLRAGWSDVTHQASVVQAMRDGDPEEYKRAMRASVAASAQRLADAVDAQVLEKILEGTVATTTGPNSTLDAQRIKRVLHDMTDEKVTIDIYISSRSFSSAVRVFFEDYSYGHELGITSGAGIDALIAAFDDALEGLQRHIEKKEMEAWL